MSIRVLFFGATSEAVGSKEMLVTLTSGSVDSLLQQLKASYFDLTNHRLLVAVNQVYATSDTVLNDGDEVAIFTPVSGG